MTSVAHTQDSQSNRLADRYAEITKRIGALEREREQVRTLLLQDVGPRRGTFTTRHGAVKVLDRPTCRYDPTRLLAVLDETRFLRDVAVLQPPRVRRHMEANLAFARAVAPVVETATYTYVGVVP